MKKLQECIINHLITVRLENEGIFIYIKGKKFLKYPSEYFYPINTIEQIDVNEKNNQILKNPLEKHFKELCFYLKKWVEKDYDTSILNKRLAFQLLERLVDCGEVKKKSIFKREIIKTIRSENYKDANFLIEFDYLEYLDENERNLLFLQEVRNGNLPIILYLFTKDDTQYINRDEINHNLLNPQSTLFLNIYRTFEDYNLRDFIFTILHKFIEANILNAKKIFRELFVKAMKMVDLPTLKFLSSLVFFNHLEANDYRFFFLENNTSLKKIVGDSLDQENDIKITWLFILLFKLSSNGDIIAKKMYRRIIIKKLSEGRFIRLISYWNDHYLDFFNIDELELIFKELKIKEINIKSFKHDHQRIMSAIINLPSLQILTLSPELLLEGIPDSIKDLHSLQVLNLSECNISILPTTLKSLTYLKGLNLSGNNLKSLPDWIGDFKSLENLYLSYNNLEILPESMQFLQSLRVLNLKNNNLKSLPDWIGNLNLLKKLRIGRNKLKSLPLSMRNLISLEFLDLENNSIKILPDWIGDLTSLQTIYISCNKLNILPKSLIQLEFLKILDYWEYDYKTYLDNNSQLVLEHLRRKGVGTRIII
ncbi:MAG: leucine-rich repeat domain-containing protein [Promethearchaeota archaeon]